MAKSQYQEIDLLGSTVEYEIQYSADATKARIDVDIHGVTVIVPQGETVHPPELLKQNAAWVLDKQRSYDTYREQVPDRSFEDGEYFPFLGENHEVVVEVRKKPEIDNGSIRLNKNAVKQSSVRQLLENLYRNRAREYLTERLDNYAEQMSIKYERLELRNQRTRWGSCSTGGTISLNWRLIMAPPEIVDYLIVHELAHLSEQNHGDEFWTLVETQIPDYREKAQWLDENSAKLIFTEDDL